MSVALTTLPNGFRIATEPMAGLESASIGIWVTAGARNESLPENGMAHFLEHMAFKGTTMRSPLQIAQEIEDVGGYLNAYTSREMTAYYARVLRGDVPLALDVIADILRNPTFDEAEIDIERGVILQEIGQANDTPDDVVFDWLQDVSYPKQALGRTILGPAENVSEFGRDDLLAFVAKHYGPERMILSAAGGIDPDAIVAQATALFGDMEAHTSILPEPGKFIGGETRTEKDLEQAHFTFALEAPHYRDDRIYAVQLFSNIFGGGMSSRLFQEIREKQGLCYSVYSQLSAFSDTGSFLIYSGTSGDKVDVLARSVLTEFEKAAEDITDAEIARARAQMKAGMLMGLEGASSRAERMARMVDIWGRVPDLSETVAVIDAVTRDDVRNVARDLLFGPAAMALYGPVGSAPSLDDLRG
ncbi:MAG: M16 family metallopeptidase [Halocynthiibacter sp.]